MQNWVGTKTDDVSSLTVKEELLKVENLQFGYSEEKLALENVNFTIYEGEMVSIVGKNGAGKSTLAKLICGFETPVAGKISLRGRDLAGDTIKERAAAVGYVMQNPNQMISKPMIWDEVEMALLQMNMSAEERKERVEETLKICGLYPFRKWPVSALSFGQKKRVTIASILVQRYTILIITHDMHLMLEYTSRAIVFSDGKLLADTTTARVLNDPELVKKANLKETSLYTLSLACGIEEPLQLTERFIRYEKEAR